MRRSDPASRPDTAAMEAAPNMNTIEGTPALFTIDTVSLRYGNGEIDDATVSCPTGPSGLLYSLVSLQAQFQSKHDDSGLRITGFAAVVHDLFAAQNGSSPAINHGDRTESESTAPLPESEGFEIDEFPSFVASGMSIEDETHPATAQQEDVE